MGMKATIMIAGACAPTPCTATMKPRVAARLYAGAVEATPMTRFETYPRTFPFRPLPPGCAPSGVWAATDALSIRFSPSHEPLRLVGHHGDPSLAPAPDRHKWRKPQKGLGQLSKLYKPSWRDFTQFRLLARAPRGSFVRGG